MKKIHKLPNGSKIKLEDISFISSIGVENCGSFRYQQRFHYHIIMKSGKTIYIYSDQWDVNLRDKTRKYHLEKARIIEETIHKEYTELVKDWETIVGI